MFLSSTLEDVGDSLDVTVGPRGVRGTDGSSGGGNDDEETDGENGLLVGDLFDLKRRDEENVGYPSMNRREIPSISE